MTRSRRTFLRAAAGTASLSIGALSGCLNLGFLGGGGPVTEIHVAKNTDQFYIYLDEDGFDPKNGHIDREYPSIVFQNDHDEELRITAEGSEWDLLAGVRPGSLRSASGPTHGVYVLVAEEFPSGTEVGRMKLAIGDGEIEEPL